MVDLERAYVDLPPLTESRKVRGAHMSQHLLRISRALMSKALQNACTEWNEPDARCLWNPYYLDSNHTPLPRFLVEIGRDLMFIDQKELQFLVTLRFINQYELCGSWSSFHHFECKDVGPTPSNLVKGSFHENRKKSLVNTFHICLSHADGCCDVAGASPLHNSWTGVAVQGPRIGPGKLIRSGDHPRNIPKWTVTLKSHTFFWRIPWHLWILTVVCVHIA